MRKARSSYPTDLQQALTALGAGLRELRVRRRIPMACAADQVLISRSTLHRVERGDPGVSLGIYASVLRRYGMLARLAALAEARFDRDGLAIEAGRLPRRIRQAGPA